MRSLCLPSRVAACLAALVLAACGGSWDDDDDFLPLALSSTLTAAEEVPPNTTLANGVGLVTIDADGRTLNASVVVSGMADTDAHIHLGSPGANGPIVFPLSKQAGTTVWTTRAPVTEAQLDGLLAGNYYFNVHSAAFPNGQIRGQITWSMPTPEQEAHLALVRQQSAIVELQLNQVEEIRDAEDDNFTGIGFGLTIGF
jgi:hypothetical protein